MEKIIVNGHFIKQAEKVNDKNSALGFFYSRQRETKRSDLAQLDQTAWKV
jgi:hypothetical protein